MQNGEKPRDMITRVPAQMEFSTSLPRRQGLTGHYPDRRPEPAPHGKEQPRYTRHGLRGCCLRAVGTCGCRCVYDLCGCRCLNAKSTRNLICKLTLAEFDALTPLAAPLASASYTTIYSNFFHPSVHSHPPTSLQKFLQTLTPGGILTLREPVLLEPLPPATCPVTRSSQELVSALRLTGFIDITIASLDPVAEQDLTDFFHVWGATRVEQGITVLGGKLAVATVVARKPAYEVGQKVALNFARKTNPVVGDGGPAKSTAAAWTLSLNDEDEELEDEDALLDEEDKIKPSKASLT
ncbi:hypothetical protein BC938DRAFT_472410, partial [Jimgerdemannia flammicorona]